MTRAEYLRVKHWRTYQHYSDRRPPWIKLMRELIDGDNGRSFREQLTEAEQWQLVRLWLYASGSEVVMRDQDAREVPLIPYDEPTLRLGIRSLKKVAVEKFVRLGFLEPVHASAVASTTASTPASTGHPESGFVTAPPRARVRATEVPDKNLRAVTPVRDVARTHEMETIKSVIDVSLAEAAGNR